MIPPVINPGDLDRRLTLDAPVETDDGAGGVSTTYQSVALVWAQVVPLTARAECVADSPSAALRYAIVIRYRNDITTRHRFQDGGRIYQVLTVQPATDRRFLEIAAEEWSG